MTTYTCDNPSPEYVEAVRLGIEFQQRSKVFTGRHCWQSYPILRQLMRDHNSKTVLDFGAGKLEQFTYRDILLLNHKDDEEKTVYPTWQEALGAEEICPYDPCILEIATLPHKQFDGIYTTDVLEHIPPADLADWVVPLLFSYARHWVYASVASYPGKKRLSDGSLAHKAIQPLEWWLGSWTETAKRYPSITWELRYEPDVPPITHRRFHGKGEWWAEAEGWWRVWKPQQLTYLTSKEREELEMFAKSQNHPVDPRAFGKK
jgi:hypothetical protein